MSASRILSLIWSRTRTKSIGHLHRLGVVGTKQGQTAFCHAKAFCLMNVATPCLFSELRSSAKVHKHRLRCQVTHHMTASLSDITELGMLHISDTRLSSEALISRPAYRLPKWTASGLAYVLVDSTRSYKWRYDISLPSSLDM